MFIMKKRAQFLKSAAEGRRCARPGLVLQGRFDSELSDPVIGFTVTKKVGNAVVRNRVKRKLRAVAREILDERGFDLGHYVVIGRQETLERRNCDIKADLYSALRRIKRDEEQGVPLKPYGARRGKKA